jgi:serine/threonine protein kinase
MAIAQLRSTIHSIRMPNSPLPQPLPPDLSDAVAAGVLRDVLLPRDIASQQPGDEVGPYVLVEQLGVGGFGTVWLAEQEEPVRRTVALKILKLGMDTLEVMARFESERQTLALMDHPNIAKVVDAGTTPEGRPFFAMELVRGEPLTKYCLEKSLSLEQRLRLFQSVCAGVQHAHQKGIIHRDLKPSNILVTEIDGLPVPKIIDFGIAKATTTDRLNDFALVTRLDQLMGTPIYMSPEQADAHPNIDTRSDVYALGALLYELLTGRPPFDRETLHGAGYDEMRRIIREVEPMAPSRRSDEGHTSSGFHPSKDLDLITLHALAKDRERRYQSATALLEDIERYLNHEPIIARAPTALYLTQRWVRRHWLVTVAITGALGLIGIGTATTYWQKQKAEAALQLMASALSQTDTISYVSLTQMGEVLALAAARADDLQERDQMRLHTGLGKAYWGLRDWPTAILHLEKAEALATRLHGHPDIVRELREWRVLCLLGGQRAKEALALTEQMMPDYEKNLLPDDPVKIFVLITHAKALRAAGQPKEAVAAFEALFARLDKWPTEPNPEDIVSAHLSYPIALRQAGQKERALVEARKTIRLAKKLLGFVDMHTARAYVQAGNECEAAGLTQEAHDHQKEAWQLFIDKLGPAHFSTQEAKKDLLRLEDKLGLVDEAIQVHKDTVEESNSRLGPTDPVALEAAQSLMDALLKASRWDEALQAAQESVSSLEAVKRPSREVSAALVKARATMVTARRKTS